MRIYEYWANRYAYLCALFHIDIYAYLCYYNIRKSKEPQQQATGREVKNMKRRKVRFCDAARVAGYEEWWQVPIENMGFCKDGVTRWYFFEAEDGTPCVTFKY